jgi:hypothetical protein
MYILSYVLVTGFVFSIRTANACYVEEGSSSPPPFIIAFIVSLLAVSVLTLLFWGVTRLFSKRTLLSTALIVATSLLSMFLGVIGSFVVPGFEQVYVGFGADIPPETKTLINARHFLWLPALLVLALWRASENSSNKARYFAATLFIEVNLLFMVLWALYAPLFKMGHVLCG